MDDDKIVTDDDRALALEMKARANKAFSGKLFESPIWLKFLG